ncbi:hypothetical protein [Thiorhodospira sibirica]|uniref:hypothetical protein n=1 Tax=Thiorhodospira sibirica TaxID=154347 RepID=UPI001111D035|nr:hypothetical protein [Thiorhodospira sibirica]
MPKIIIDFRDFPKHFMSGLIRITTQTLLDPVTSDARESPGFSRGEQKTAAGCQKPVNCWERRVVLGWSGNRDLDEKPSRLHTNAR